jgi:hypothetical protein
MRERDGFTVRLHAMPAPNEGEYTILLMPPKPRDETRQMGRNDYGGSAHQSRDIDDEIPF